MTHPLVLQLRFARSEFQRGLVGVTDEEARRRFLPMNSIGWNIGHLAWQEQRYWLSRAQNRVLRPDIQEAFAYGAPASTPTLVDVQAAWHELTAAADPWLEAQTTETLQGGVTVTRSGGQPFVITFGSLLLRTIYHYWYHNGENQAIRQLVGHSGLPDFVGNIDDEAPYRPE
ncbi:MAG: DinB family protein [Anaerolineales bacterium]|nr:DinB family protein [Anaerolineales bacterium]